MASEKKHPNKTGDPPTELEFEKALMFFHAYMYGPLQGKLRLYSARSVRSPGAAASSDWEVFASILVNDAGKKFAAGVDLTDYEVNLPQAHRLNRGYSISMTFPVIPQK